MKFFIRDVLWLTVVVAVGLGWWLDTSTPTELEQITQAVAQRTRSKILAIRWEDDGAVNVTAGRGDTCYTLKKQNGVWKVIAED